MPAILVSAPIDESEVKQWEGIFPQYRFLHLSRAEVTDSEWEQVEIIYGCELSPRELALATQLRWIHCPTPFKFQLCLKEIRERGNVLLTYTEEQNREQASEFVFGGILSFAKNLFYWHAARTAPRLLKEAGFDSTMWSLDSRIFLQIGLDSIGQELVRRANQFGMRVWGMSDRRTFRATCHKTLDYKELHSVLPSADIICVRMPPFFQSEFHFGEREFELVKDDAILIFLGVEGIELGCLKKKQVVEKLRGLIIDTHAPLPFPEGDPFWATPQLLVTPGVSSFPQKKGYQTAKNFMFNLRQYLQKNYGDMKGWANVKRNSE